MFIPYARQSISKNDIDAVEKVLKSDFLTQGPLVPAFENTISNYCNVKYSVATNSATSALHIACLALDVGPGDIVWTSPNSFVASANCAVYCGAKVDFVDIDPDTFTLSIPALIAKLNYAKENNVLPKVVIPVHFAGQSCDMEAINRLSKQFGFSVIEDASHAIGASFQDLPIGNCKYSDIVILSFHPVKIITAGEGGMALTNNENLAESMMKLRSHGIVRNETSFKNRSDGPWYYEQIDIGFNYRLTDIAAALGLSQFQRLEDFVQRRNELADNYRRMFLDSKIKTPLVQDNVKSSFHLYVVQISVYGIHKQKLFDYARTNGVGLNVHYIPIYRQPFYDYMKVSASDFPNTERYYSSAISIPMYVDLTAEEQRHVVSVLNTATNMFMR
jgi:UDP-4-amino-4,6-dideoxy-N-acetyl-beta-L-altrosamine transaminase